MRANQLPLWLSSLAYVLMCAVRRIGLAGTELERATCATIRLVLLKLGACVTISVRREARVRVKLPKGRRVRTRRKAIMHLSGCDRIRARRSTNEEHD